MGQRSVGDDSGGWWIISTPIFRLSIIFVHLLLHLPLITISMGASSPDFLPFCDLWTDGSVVKFSISSQVSRWRGLTTLSGCCLWVALLCNSTGLSIELRWKSFYVTSVSRPKSWPGSGRGAVALEMEFGGVTEGKLPMDLRNKKQIS